ncbi:hypothetical protein [Streptomyces sp. NPDC005209]|uniref:hypothetical protein n=1 Tax=Streptomyces sp. NPDC005209 TaxID=3156715 RepID=UPI0033BABE4D
MQRTTTTATLLVTVAVSALSGCVTVQRPPAPGPSVGTVPSPASAPRPDGSAEPRVVQAPAREALEMVGPARRPTRAETPQPRRPATPATPRRLSPPRAHPRPQPHRQASPQPQAEIPAVSPALPAPPDVCALGRQYGGWRPDSPQAAICAQTYGR